MNEKTSHVYCVFGLLIKKYDRRTNAERYPISKKQYIRDNIHLSELQEKYYKRLNNKSYDLGRCIKDSDRKYIKIKKSKKIKELFDYAYVLNCHRTTIKDEILK